MQDLLLKALTRLMSTRDEAGQAMVEYGILLALIATIIAITAVISANRVILFAGAFIALAGIVVIPTIHPLIGIAIMLFGGAICGTSMLLASRNATSR